MPTMQEFIHKFDVGEGTRYIKLAAVTLGLMALTVAYDIREFKNFSLPEAMDLAQVARHISEGKGYTTDYIRPLSIHLLQQRRADGVPVLREAHPDLANAPLYPYILAAAMKVLPFKYEISKGGIFWHYEPEMVIALINQAFFLLTVFLVFRLALRLFDASVAWVSALILAGTDLLWRFSISGLPTMLLMLFLVGIAWCLVVLEHNQREGQRSTGWFILMAALTGGLVGLGGLTLYSFAWLIVPVVAFLAIFLGPRRILVSVLALAACVAVLSPWLVRNYRLSGNFFGTAGYAVYQESLPFRGNRLERFMGPEVKQELSRVSVGDFARKLVANGGELLHNNLPTLGGNWISALFLASLLIPFRNTALNRMRVFVLMALLTLLVTQALGKTHLSTGGTEIHSENLIVLVAPLLFVFGVGMLFILLDQINWPFSQLRTLGTAACGVLVCLPLILTLLPPRSLPFAYPPYWPPGIQDSASFMAEDELMMSDMPWAVAWYGSRQCLLLTLEPPFDPVTARKTDFFKIYDHQKPIQAIYLTRLTTDAQFYAQILRDKDYGWSRLMIEALLRGNVPTGFPLRQAPPYFLEEGQLFLSDRVRWKKPSS
jgi:hypothetical protein